MLEPKFQILINKLLATPINLMAKKIPPLAGREKISYAYSITTLYPSVLRFSATL